jgi:hypothetical protein
VLLNTSPYKIPSNPKTPMATTVISQNQAMLEYRKYILAIGNLTKPNKAGVQKIHSGNWSRRVKKACLPSVKAKSILGAFFSFGIDMEKEELWATDASPPQKADRLMLKSKLEANKVIIFKYLRLHQNCSPFQISSCSEISKSTLPRNWQMPLTKLPMN